MSETAPAPAMPLFFKRVVGLNPSQHGALRLDRTARFGFAAGAQTIPVGLGEFDVTARNYPILFAAAPTPMPVALVGLNDGGNLMLQPDSTWRTDAYVPAYVRAFPFIFVEDAAKNTTYVGVEPDAACLTQDAGTPLFEDGKPTPTLNEAIGFCSALRDNLTAAITFARAMDAAGVLEEEEATVNFNKGGGARIRGFKVIKPNLLDKVSDETFLDWRRRGWIGAIYAHMHSASQWGRLIDIAAARLAAA
jgi:hypothetical protein